MDQEEILLGYCKECGNEVYSSDEIADYPGIFECSGCGHPHSRNELWDELPDYLAN